MKDQLILIAPSKDSTNQLLRVLRTEYPDIKFWSEDWFPIGVRIWAFTTEEKGREITRYANQFLGYQ